MADINNLNKPKPISSNNAKTIPSTKTVPSVKPAQNTNVVPSIKSAPNKVNLQQPSVQANNSAVPPRVAPQKQAENVNNVQDTVSAQQNLQNTTTVNNTVNQAETNNVFRPIFNTEKPKIEKQKPKKEPLSKKMKLIILIVSISVFVVIATVSTILIVHFNNISKKIQTPNYMVYLKDLSSVIEIEKNDRAEYYEYTIIKDGQQTVYKLKSNKFETKDYLNQAGEYQIKVRILGKVEKAHSDYSETKVITNKKYLDAPIIHKTEQNGEVTQIFWLEVNNADYYQLQYKANQNGEIEYLRVDKDQSNSGTIQFDMQTLYNLKGAGRYTISVIAIPHATDKYYEKSKESNLIIAEHYKKIQGVTSAVYNSDKTLEFKTENKTETEMPKEYAINISYVGVIEEVVYNVIVSELIDVSYQTIDNVNYVVYKVDLSNFITGNIEKITVTALGDDNYYSNSEPTSVVLP